jgi:hypothetical protein
MREAIGDKSAGAQLELPTLRERNLGRIVLTYILDFLYYYGRIWTFPDFFGGQGLATRTNAGYGVQERTKSL